MKSQLAVCGKAEGNLNGYQSHNHIKYIKYIMSHRHSCQQWCQVSPLPAGDGITFKTQCMHAQVGGCSHEEPAGGVR